MLASAVKICYRSIYAVLVLYIGPIVIPDKYYRRHILGDTVAHSHAVNYAVTLLVLINLIM